LRALLDSQPEPYRAIAINFWGLNTPTQLAPFFDAFGSEGRSNESGNNWDTPILDYRRATAMGRMRSFANQASNLTLEEVKRYAHEALFYGMWTQRGPNGGNWPSGWEDALDWQHEQVRPLLSFGWQPVTYAVSDHPDVWVERFGFQAFTVHNWGDAPTDFTLTIDLAALGISADGLTVTESVSEGTIDSYGLSDSGNLEIQGRLEPGRTAVYWLGN